MLAWLRAAGKLTDDHSKAAGEAFFEMARSLAKTDLSVAEKYASERIGTGPFFATGPAAPINYRLAYHSFGFKNAERIAALIRR